MTPLPMTPYQQHRANWNDCKACFLHETRQHVVLARGQIPCDVLFIGEAPGESEDSLGQPFKGLAGRRLDIIVNDALAAFPKIRKAFTNLLACIPREEGIRKAPKLDPESVLACAPRLAEFVRICDPSLIVAVGREAEDYIDPRYKHSLVNEFHKRITVVKIDHPAFILRLPPVHQPNAMQRCTVTIRDAVEEMYERREKAALEGEYSDALGASDYTPQPYANEDDIPF